MMVLQYVFIYSCTNKQAVGWIMTGHYVQTKDKKQVRIRSHATTYKALYFTPTPTSQLLQCYYKIIINTTVHYASHTSRGLAVSLGRSPRSRIIQPPCERLHNIHTSTHP